MANGDYLVNRFLNVCLSFRVYFLHHLSWALQATKWSILCFHGTEGHFKNSRNIPGLHLVFVVGLNLIP